MITGVRLDPLTIGREYADLIRAEMAADRLWVREDQGVIELFLITKPIGPDTERRLSGLTGDLIRQYPTTLVRLHLLNPNVFEPEADLLAEVASDAQPVSLQQ